MGKKNKYKPKPDGAGGDGGGAGPSGTQQQQPAPAQVAPPQQPQPPQQQPAGADGGRAVQQSRQRQQQQQQRPQQQQQQWPQQQQAAGGSGWPQQQQQRPQQQQQQQRPQQQQQQQRPQQQQQQQQQHQQQRPQQQQGAGGDSWRQQQPPPQQQQQRPQQQQQQWPQQQQAAGGSGWPQQQQQWPQQQLQFPQQQQQWPQQQQAAGGSGWQQQRPQQEQQQQRPQQQQQQQHQQQRPQQQQGAGGGGRQQQQPPPQQQQQRPQQQQQQQRPQQQQGAGGDSWRQQQPPPQQQQQRPQQQQQQQRPQQQQGAVGGGRQQQQQQRPQQQQQRPQQQQQQGAGGSGPRQQQPPPVRQMQGQASVSHASSSASLASSTSVSSIKRGTAGIHGQVEVNYLQMDLSKMPDVAYHYDVTIDPDRPKKYIRGAFSKFVNEFLGGIACAFDGQKSCYTVQRLEHDLYDGEVELDDTGGRSIKFKVTVKATDTIEVDLSSLKTYQQERIYDKPMRALQCLEVALANACHNRGVRTGRSFYVKPQQKIDLKDGYELWTGLFQAAILGDQPFVNVDISHKSFPSECSLIDWLRLNTDINRPLDHRAISSLRTFLKGLQIMYRPPESFGAVPKTYTVQDVLQEPANRLSFTLEDGRKMTVCEYFQSRNYTLRYPHLNCLHLGSRVRTNYMPIELCYIPSGQTINKKDGPRQVQEMIRYAATSTDERKRKIMHLLNYFAHNTDPLIGRFGIRLGSQFIQVPMRLLRAPGIEYCGGELLRVQNGSWRLNLSTKFLATSKPQPSHKWAIIYSKRGRTSIHVVQKFASMLSDAAKKLGMFLADRPEIRDFDNIDKVLSEMKTQNFNLVIVILPAFGTSYAETKQKAELRCGILTQCIKEQTVDRRLDHQLVLNLLLKINAKLNGTNHKIANDPQVLLKNVMYIGADVTHPSPDQRHLPSVVGVAASHDAHGACYNMQYRLQRSTLEEIEDMGNIFAHHLKVYHAHQKQYPNHVIYYRDGVSDGQFPKIRDQELAAMRAACKRLQLSPKFTCIIVVKRHHTRFFPQTEADRFNKFNNVVPGTVVDRVIVHPNEVQFFMVSHQSIQGTAKPTRYNVIVDDAHLDIDLVQKLTNNLCHMFPRCNRAVSYPAPAYLAHLAAFRGRVYLEGQNTFRDLREEYNRRLINPGFLTSNPMYFV